MSDPKTKLQKYSAPALEKGLDIMEYLSLTSEKPTLSQIAAGIGRSKNEIFRMMIVLEERGYILRNEGDLFELTDRLAILGSERSGNGKLAEISQIYLENLAELTSMSNHLSVIKDGKLLTIANIDAVRSYGLSVQVGHLQDIFGTSAGACFIAGLESPEVRAEVLQGLDVGVRARSMAQFTSMVRECAENGYVQAPNPELNAITELSAPVKRQSNGMTIATVTIPVIGSSAQANEFSGICAHLLQVTRALQEKIAITMPSLRGANAHAFG